MSTAEFTRQRGDAAHALAAQCAGLQLLEAASEIFVERGYHLRAWTRSRSTLESANLFSPALPSKLDLYLAVVDLYAEKLVSDVNAAPAHHHRHNSSAYGRRSKPFDFIDEDNPATG